MPGTVGSIETSTISCTDCLSTFSMSRRERNVRVQEVQLDASWLHQSPLHRPSSSKKQLQLSSSIVINVKARAGARLRRSVDPMQQFVCLPYQLMRSAVGVIVVLAQLQNHCRSRETCSFGTPDAVVCRAARSASAALAAVGPSVGIGPRIGVCVVVVVCRRHGERSRRTQSERRTGESPISLLSGQLRNMLRAEILRSGAGASLQTSWRRLAPQGVSEELRRRRR